MFDKLRVPLINGRRFGWGQISIAIAGIVIADIVGIEYGDEQEKELDYGAGNLPKGTVRGRRKPTAKLTLNTEIVQLLRSIAIPFGGSIMDIPPFAITVVYELEVGVPLIIHNLIGCEFTKDDVKWKEGDKKYDQEMEMIVKAIKWNGVV